MRISQIKEAVARDEEGTVVPIVDFSNDGAPYLAKDGSRVTVTVTGLQTQARRDADDEEAAIIRRVGQAALATAPSIKRRGRLAAACVVSWHGWEDENDQPIPLTRDNVATSISIDERVLEQVEAGIARHSSFLPKR